MKSMEISRSGLDVEWRRLEIIAENLANMQTSSAAGQPVYTARRLLSGPAGSFAEMAGVDRRPVAGAVTAYGIENLVVAPRRVHEPGHPHADSEGFVSYPAINMADEMTQMIKTARAYESNIVAMNLARQMYSKALDLGKFG